MKRFSNYLEQNGFARYVGDFVYGANDGVITTFAIVASSVGAKLSPFIVIILGFANLIADGISMAASNYLATKSETQYLELDQQEHKHLKNPFRSASVTFFGFVVVGFAPLSAYVIRLENAFFWASILAGISLFFVGAGRTIVTKKWWLRNGLEMLLIGTSAAFAAYGIGVLLRGLVSGI